MADLAPVSTPTPVIPWWKHPENWTAIMTVFTVVLTACGFQMTADDQHTIIVSGGGAAISLIQFGGAILRTLKNRVS